MRKKILFLVSAFVLLTGCSESGEIPADTPFESYVYMERDPSYPLILSKPMDMSGTRAIGLELEDYLGRSFRTNYFPFESVENIGYPVIDVKRIEADGLTWASAKKVRKSETKAFAYANYERYVDNSMIVTKVKSGFQINFGLFKIGKKKTMTEIFKTEFENETNYVMGQLDVEIKDAVYELQINTNTLNQIRARYIHPDFKDNLYNLHPSEFFKTYGGFVLTEFVTGGRATALYAGQYNNTASAQIMENDMTLDIGASFGFNSDDPHTAEFGFGGNFNNGKSYTGKFSNMRTSIITQGGGYGHGAFTIPEATGSLNINLSPWGASMNDESTHTIIDIADEGLLPLTGIVLEDNLKKKFLQYYETGVESIEEYQEPILWFLYGEFTTMNIIKLGLRTRTGENILLYDDIFWLDTGVWEEFLEDLIETYRSFYKLKTVHISPPLRNDYNFDYWEPDQNFYELGLVKYVNHETNMMYLLHDKKRAGYSIYIKDDYLLDTYTIREWVDSLPEKEITMNDLNTYTIVAL